MIHDDAQKATLTGQIMPAELAEHLRGCPECQAEVAQLKSLESRVASAKPLLGDRPPWEEALLGRLTTSAPAAVHRRTAGGGWMAVAASTLLAAAALAAWITLAPAGSGSPLPFSPGAGESWAAAELASDQEWVSFGVAEEDSTAALLQTSEALSDRIPEAASVELAPYLAPFDPGGWDG
jgi:hypothetical protein